MVHRDIVPVVLIRLGEGKERDPEEGLGVKFTLAGSLDSTICPIAVRQPCNSSAEITPS